MEKKSPQVSILMPLYNAEKYVAQTIESMLAQTFTDFEYLIINDGSRDNSLAIAQAYADRDPRIVIHSFEQNKGIVAAMNQGLSMARGTYIARMDADDIAVPERLQRQYQYMEAHPHIGLCGSAIEYFPKKNLLEFPDDNKVIKTSLLYTNVIAHPTVFMRKEVLDKYQIRYDARFMPAEDYEIWCRMAKVTDIYNFRQTLLHYRITDTQISTSRALEQVNMKLRINKINFRQLFDTLGLDNPFAEEMTNHAFHQAIIHHENIILQKCEEAGLDSKEMNRILYENLFDFIYYQKKYRPSFLIQAFRSRYFTQLYLSIRLKLLIKCMLSLGNTRNKMAYCD